MSSQVLKVSSGETIQVRTGVIQGVGPAGPPGPQGVGIQGPPGPQGVPGPQGEVSEFSLEAAALSTAIASATESLATFGQITRDDILAATSGTTFQLSPGGWQGTVWVSFSKQSGVNATGSRRISAVYKGTVIDSVCVGAAPTFNTDLTLAFNLLSTLSTDQLQFTIEQDGGATLTYTSRLWISRIGSGPAGPAGPTGVGTIGPPGPQGPPGPSGTIGNNNTTFASIGG